MEVLFLLLSVHLLFDYVIQSEESINKRMKEVEGVITINHKRLIVHGLTQVIPVSILFLYSGLKWYDYLIIVIAFLTHLAIDYIKLLKKIPLEERRLRLEENGCKENAGCIELAKIDKVETYLYIVDQLLHILVIVFVFLYLETKWITKSGFVLIENNILDFVLENIKYVFALFLVGSFFNVTFKVLTKKYKPDSETPSSSSKAGALVGTLERVLILLVLLGGNYTAIGYIIAAKSIARFGKMQDKDFAEYYLIGTLSSLIWSILVFSIVL